MDTSIRPFQIKVAQRELDELKARLIQTRWPDEMPGLDGNAGPAPGYMKELAEYWRTSYDWRKQEERLNGSPNIPL